MAHQQDVRQIMRWSKYRIPVRIVVAEMLMRVVKPDTLWGYRNLRSTNDNGRALMHWIDKLFVPGRHSRQCPFKGRPSADGHARSSL
jgi:hypothetical protein